ncbi:hypothetical protein PMPD1_0552 [Paramixta manurensis]|uniref:Transglycosylase SLT domain-containing protein n=1 Tax=Paramixta manurensis TaxID=2740817 RepID=A0A6M8UAN3_9GAMM|nr:hypothetical protein PMPD1_0552 [Erwiniaceae bacterium PD-1]
MNMFCQVDNEGFPHWNGIDFMRFWFLPNNHRFLTGENYLWAYKASFLVYNRSRIIKIAREEKIPPFLLAGVAAAEVGGTPERLKGYGVLQFRQLIEFLINTDNKWSNAVSVGAVAIQLRAVAETLGLDPSQLSSLQQFQLSTCLLNNEFNLRIVAQHLKQLIFADYPNTNTEILNDEQIILAGSRYNRGTQRIKQDFIDSIHASKGDPMREYSSYGRRILEKKKTLNHILGIKE